MTVLNHTLTGAVIAVAVKNPTAAIGLAFLSHFVLDAIPHIGASNAKSVFERNKKLSFQLVLGFSIIITAVLLPIIFNWANGAVSGWQLLACIIAANFPDLIWVPRFFREIATHQEKPRGPFSEMHVRMQRESMTLGLANESIWFAVMLISLLVLTP
jgi:hypothetical protein